MRLALRFLAIVAAALTLSACAAAGGWVPDLARAMGTAKADVVQLQQAAYALRGTYEGYLRVEQVYLKRPRCPAPQAVACSSQEFIDGTLVPARHAAKAASEAAASYARSLNPDATVLEALVKGGTDVITKFGSLARGG